MEYYPFDMPNRKPAEYKKGTALLSPSHGSRSSAISDLVTWLNEYCRPAEKPKESGQQLSDDRQMRILRVIELLSVPKLSLRRSEENFKAAKQRTKELQEILDDYIWRAYTGVSTVDSLELRVIFEPLNLRGDPHEPNEGHALRLILELARLGILDRVRRCSQCGGWYFATRYDKSYCSTKCKDKHNRSTDRAKFFWRGYMRWQYRYDHEITKLRWPQERRRLKEQWEKEHGSL